MASECSDSLFKQVCCQDFRFFPLPHTLTSSGLWGTLIMFLRSLHRCLWDCLPRYWGSFCKFWSQHWRILLKDQDSHFWWHTGLLHAWYFSQKQKHAESIKMKVNLYICIGQVTAIPGLIMWGIATVRDYITVFFPLKKVFIHSFERQCDRKTDRKISIHWFTL